MRRLLSGIALVAMHAATAHAQKDEARQARELDAADPQMRPVLFAAVDHLFDPGKGPTTVGFSGVVVKKKPEVSLSAEVRQILTARGLARVETPAGCETLPGRSGPTPPAGVSRDGTPLQPARTGTTKPLGASICNRGFEYSYSFHMVRVAGDSAYVETHVAGTGRSSTKCLSLVVSPEGGWKAVELKSGKIGKCGA